jgi:hypothetical protein
MEIKALEIRARMADFSHGGDLIRLFGIKQNGSEDVVATSLTMAKHSAAMSYPAFAEIDKTTAQVLIDDLWRCGIRPSEGSLSAGSLLATQNHLNDMRKIVFKKLDIDQEK